MALLDDLAHRHTELGPDDLARLRALLADWQLLADLSFCDLVLWLPTWNGSGYVAAALVRPSTGPTALVEDLVGVFLARGRHRVVDDAFASGRTVEADPGAQGPIRATPVPLGGSQQVMALVAQHAVPSPQRSGLELVYVQVADQLFAMVAAGEFPVPGDEHDPEEAPRVGDGLLLLDEQGEVTYASPNARSAYRRLGLAAELVGVPFVGTTQALAPARGPGSEDRTGVLAGRVPGATEVEARGAVVALRTIPLLAGGRRGGTLVLLRDVSDLRSRDRELVTKDATIREIHHRVKNSLQTVAALLRLQARRLRSTPEAVSALAEAEQRVTSIALVHETLSTNPDPQMPFDEVADRLLAMVTDVATGPTPPTGAGVVTRREGSFGVLGADLATPLALVLTELVHNAVEHGLVDGCGSVTVRPTRTVDLLEIAVEDDGRGLPPRSEDEYEGLGLQIARTLVADLGGSVELGPRQGGGTRAMIRVPLPDAGASGGR